LLTNEFGKLSDKATAIIVLQVIQITETPADTQVLVSKVSFIETPGTEILTNDQETVKLRQGPTLNQSIFGLQDICLDLASGKVDVINYSCSQLTKAVSELLGGNTATLGIFNFQSDDQIGSGTTLKMLKLFQRIVNFPILNDNRAICLLHKLRRENVNLKRVLYGGGGETVEQLQFKIAELEKKLIGTNLESMRTVEDKKMVNERMQELKDKYNAVLKQKAEIQTQLLNAEEEKLSLSKGLIEQQIENAKLQEQIQSIRYEADTKGIHAESDAIASESRLEKAQKTIMDLQGELAKITGDRKEFELELMTVKRNYLNKCKEIEEFKRKNEQIGVELINVINENKALIKSNGTSINGKSAVSYEFDKFQHKISVLETENEKFREEMAKLSAELEKSNSDKVKMEVVVEQIKLDYEKKRMHLEKEYATMAKDKDGKIQAIRKVDQEGAKWRQTDKTIWESEKLDLNKRIKDLNRKIEMQTQEIQDLKDQNEELRTDKNSVSSQLEELRNAYRNKLTKAAGEEARIELINTYTMKEQQLLDESMTLKVSIDKLRTKCKSLREYARQLKIIAEDFLPEDKPKPDILQVDEPPIIKEEYEVMLKGKKEDQLIAELSKMKEENYTLRTQVEQLQEKVHKLKESKGPSGNGDTLLQQKILEELKMLKENPKSGGRPASGMEGFDKIRKERNDLLEENLKLKQIVFS